LKILHWNWLTGLKYLTYLLLMVNVGLFLREELLALEHTFSGNFRWGDTIQIFSSTIDTAAWVVLLLLFELETSVIEDYRIHGVLKYTLHGVRGFCYLFIGYAFYGYLVELQTLYQVTLLPATDLCALVGADWSLLVDLDEYETLGAGNCAGYGSELWQVGTFDIVVDGANLTAAQLLAWTDLINSAAWILVVLVLEVDVRLQLRGELDQRAMAIGKVIKLVLYGTLFCAAVYWGVAGDFLDFWDACLWLFAFVFIEMNVFDWQAETSMPAAQAA
jgi:hypothetical protein